MPREDEYHDKFREALVELVKGIGKDIVNNANDIVGDPKNGYFTDLSLHIDVMFEGQLVDNPHIEIDRGILGTKTVAALNEFYKQSDEEEEEDG